MKTLDHQPSMPTSNSHLMESPLMKYVLRMMMTNTTMKVYRNLLVSKMVKMLAFFAE